MAPELIRRTRQLLPNLKLAQVYGLSATGFFTGLQDQEHTEDRLTSCGKPCPGIDLQVLDESGKQIEAGSPTCTRSAPDQEVAPAATPTTATIYIYRPHRFEGAAAKPPVIVDEVDVAHLHNGNAR